MGTHAKIAVYEDGEHVCTILRTSDGDDAVNIARMMASAATIHAHRMIGRTEFNMGEFPVALIAAIVDGGYDLYTRLIPEIDETFEYNISLHIDGAEKWQAAGCSIDWVGGIEVHDA